MKFSIRTECGDSHELVSLNELGWAVDRLESESGSFLVVEPEQPIDGIVFMQAVYIRKTKGLFRKTVIASHYQIEAQHQCPNGDLYHYHLDTADQNSVQAIFEDFFLSQRLPDLSAWHRELFYAAEN